MTRRVALHLLFPRGRSNVAAHGKTTKDPRVASGWIQRAADLKEGTGELPTIDVGAVAEEPKKPVTKN